MKRNKILFIINCIAILFTSCGNLFDEKPGDPLSKILYGVDDAQLFVEKNVADEVFSEPLNDSTRFRYFIKGNNKNYPVEIIVNPDLYKFGSVREIKLKLGGDTVTLLGKSLFRRGEGPRSSEELDEIYNLYVDWYGVPDSIETLNTSESVDSKNDKPPHYLGKKVFWNFNNYNIVFTLPEAIKKKNHDSGYTYVRSDGEILYQMINFEFTLQNIQDSLRAQLGPKDIVRMNVSGVYWKDLEKYTFSDYDAELIFNVDQVVREDNEERRDIKGIRFDVVITDDFEEELCRIKDVTYEPREPIPFLRGGSAIVSSALNRYSLKYHSSSNDNFDLERARHYPNSINAKADIKAIVFEDGAILRDSYVF